MRGAGAMGESVATLRCCATDAPPLDGAGCAARLDGCGLDGAGRCLQGVRSVSLPQICKICEGYQQDVCMMFCGYLQEI